jgi:hypothetical protein
MATNWIIPQLVDLAKVISIDVIGQSDENIDPESFQNSFAAIIPGVSTNPQAATDPAVEERGGDQLILAVNQWRAAIQLANKNALSVTPGAVPPEAFKSALYQAAWGLVTSTPSLRMIIMTDKGPSSVLTKNLDKANKLMDEVSAGRVVTPPTDPTGRDYLTAINVPLPPGIPAYNPALPINAPWLPGFNCALPININSTFNPALPINPPIQSTRWGGSSHIVDLTTMDSYGPFTRAPWWWPAAQIGQP